MQDAHTHACYVAYDVTHICYSCTLGQNHTVVWGKIFDKKNDPEVAIRIRKTT